jgi:putative sigma-54 modulation protein
MDLHIRGNGITVSDDLRAFADKRAARLQRLVRSVDEAKLELRHVHTRVGPDVVVAQLTLQSGKTLLRAEEQDPEAKVAIDRAADKLEQQVRKVHSKRARRRGDGVATIRTADALAAIPDEDFAFDASTEDDGVRVPEVVRTKRFALKPMHVDEAIEQMELLGHDFYLFQNADEDTFSVLYRRKGGDYGLLLPDRG